MTDTFTMDRVTWVFDQAALDRLLMVLENVDEVSWDLETTGLNEFKPDAKITLASLTFLDRDRNWHTDEPDTWLIPLYHEESPWLGSWRIVWTSIARKLVGKFLMAHNGKFDCRWTFRMTGVDLSGSQMWDSDTSSHLLDENRSRKLKNRAVATFGIENWSDEIEMDPEVGSLRIPLFTLGEYAARDTYWTWKWSIRHRYQTFMLDPDGPPLDREEVEEAKIGRLMTWVGMPSVRVTTRIEQRGFKLDVDWVKERIAENTSVRDEQFDYLRDLYPMPEHTCLSEECAEDCPAWKWPQREEASFAPTSHWFRNWTRIAVERRDLRIVSMTKGGNAQWSKEVLVRLERQGSEVAKRLLIYRKAVKRLEYLHSWLASLRSDGMVHANYNVGVTITGRLSSDGPNMQQVTKILRPAYVPRPGFVLGDFDYSQIELRIAAYIARCDPMIQAFLRGDDLHQLLAARITGKAPADVLPDERQGGKAGNFGFLFGQTAYGFKFYAENQYGISFTDEECQAIYDAFFGQWTGMADWHHRTISAAHRDGQVSSPLGRIRRLPGIFSSSDGAAKHAENAALNAPVQGMASDLMQIAAASIEGVLPGFDAVPGVALVGTVHDSLVAELPEDYWEESARLVIDRMTLGVLPVLQKMDVDFDVPLAVEASIGTRWGLKDVGEVT